MTAKPSMPNRRTVYHVREVRHTSRTAVKHFRVVELGGETRTRHEATAPPIRESQRDRRKLRLILWRE